MGDEDLARWNDGDIRRDDCMKHVHVEWDCAVSEPLLNFHIQSINSPLILVGNQTYALSLSRGGNFEDFDFSFCLYRKGPSDEDIPPVLWFAGLKRKDGTYHYRNHFGILYLDTEISTMEEVTDVVVIRNEEFFREHVATDQRFTVFLQMKVKQASTRSKICTHGFPEVTVPSRGNISEDVCPSHSRVEWDFEGSWNYAVLSPVFRIASQQYFLELRSYFDKKSLFLHRMGPSVEGPSRSIRWWAGLKRGDGTCNHSHEYNDLYLDGEFLMWAEAARLASYSNAELRAFQKKARGFTVIFQLNIEQESITEQMCTHGNSRMFPSSQGTLTKDVCSSHMRVDWNLRRCNAVSPVFEVANQRYLLRLESKANECFLYLHRMGPSVDRSVRFWAGLKRNDGTYLRWFESGYLNQEIEFSMFKSGEDYLLHIDKREYRLFSREISDGFTVFFQLNVENASTTTEACHHDPAKAIFPQNVGKIRDCGFACHEEVEWDADYDPRRQGMWTSPFFSIGNQSYRFVFRRGREKVKFYLYRLGPSSDSRMIKFTMGLKRGDETYHYKDHSGMVSLWKDHELWSCQEELTSIYLEHFASYHLSEERRFTLFFRLYVEAEVECTHDSVPAEANLWNHGETLQKECTCLKHVEWKNVDCAQIMDGKVRQWISGTFKVGKQSYALTLERDALNYRVIFRLKLLRKGPCATDPPVRWWARLRSKDGTFEYRSVFGTLDHEQRLLHWTPVECLLSVSGEILKNDYVAAGRITAFFMMREAYPSTSLETCPYDTRDPSDLGDGRIVRNECPFHRRVDWIVEGGHGKSARSSVFEMEGQRFILEMSANEYRDIVLKLYRKGPACTIDDPSGSHQWWAGLKRRNRAHNNRNKHAVLDLEKNFSMLWTQARQLLRFSSSDYLNYFYRNDQSFTVVFQLNVGQVSTRAETCNHDFRWMSPPSVGSIEQTPCPNHKRVDWRVDWNVNEPTEWAVSPVFEVENQRYLLELRILDDEVTFYLFRMGPSAGHSTGSTRWWAGLKRRDGTYHHMNESGNLNLAEDFWMWAKEEQLLRIDKLQFGYYILKSVDGFITGFDAFFQMNLEGPSTTTEECDHDPAVAMFPRHGGHIREETCASYHHVEWIIDYSQCTGLIRSLASEVFTIGNQHYRFLFSKDSLDENAFEDFHLYRLGPPVDDLGAPVQWWAGVKRSDGTYQNRNESRELLLDKECELWSEAVRLKSVEGCDLRKYHLNNREHLTFFFRVNHNTHGARACVHEGNERFPRHVGRIAEKVWTSYKLVHWELDFDFRDDSGEDMASESFAFDNQSYRLELVDLTPLDMLRSEIASTGCSVSLRLCRMGPPDKRSLKWLAGVMPRGGTFHEYGSAKGELSLEFYCKLWSFASDLHSFTIHSRKEAKRMQLTVDFLMSSEKSPPEGEERINAENQAVQDVDRLYEDDIIFKVQDVRFKMCKALVCFRAPAVGGLFQHGSVERRSGEVNLVDCEPTAVAEFFNLLKGGFRRTPTAGNAFGLYRLAHKYVIGNLMQNCLPRIIESVKTVSSFCEVARFCFKYADEDLLDGLVAVLCVPENRDIIDDDSFKNLRSEYPDDVNVLLAKASLPTN